MQTTQITARLPALVNAAVNALSALLMVLVFHHANILIHYAAKGLSGDFVFVALYVQTFGLAEVVCAQTAQMTPIHRLIAHLAPAVCYVVVFGLILLGYGRLKGRLRLLGAWVMAFCWLYGLHLTLVGTLFMGGPLGTVEDQLGHFAWSAGLLLVLVLVTGVALRVYKVRPSGPTLGSLALVVLPIYVLFAYRFLHLTEQAAFLYKGAVTVFCCLVVLIYGRTIEARFLPRGILPRSFAAAIAVAAMWWLPAPYQNLCNRVESLIEQGQGSPFPPITSAGDVSGGIIVSDELLNRVLVIFRDGRILTLADDIDEPECVYYDKTGRRLIVSGVGEMRVYDEPFGRPPRSLISPWSLGAIECLIADDNGILVGYVPDTIARIKEDGTVEPLAKIENPDSMVRLNATEYLVGNTRRTDRHLFVWNRATGDVTDWKHAGKMDNVECILQDARGRIWLALGFLNRPATSQIATVDEEGRYSTVVKVLDVEGLVETGDGKVAFSNDRLCTVYKISSRGGVHPFAYLLDPDDLAVVGD